MKHVKPVLNLILAVVAGLVTWSSPLQAEANASTAAVESDSEAAHLCTANVSSISNDFTNGCSNALCQDVNRPILADDWVVCRERSPLCGGYYVEPALPSSNQTALALPNQSVTITANRAQFLQEGGPSILEGNVHLIEGNRQVFADQARIFRNNETGEVEKVEAEGFVQITEPGIRFVGTKAYVFVDQDKKIICNADYRLYQNHARGFASSITAFGGGRSVLRDASYTTCAPGQDTWILRARKVALNKTTGRGQATHARLFLKGIPIFYSPYFDFPIDNRRQTGFLYPYYGNTRNSGVEIATPFYWNIAPNYDATLTPRYLSRRGMDLQGEGRYLMTHHYGLLQASILPHDRAYQKFRQENSNTTLFQQNDPRVIALRRGNNSRRRIFLDHSTFLNRNWSAKVNYHKVGDDNFFFDLGDNLSTANNLYLLEEGVVTYQDYYWIAQARAQQYQTLHPFLGPVTSDPYRRAPQVGIYNMVPDLPSGFVWTTQGDFTHFTRKFELDPIVPSHTTGKRSQIRPGIALPIVHPGWFLKPRLQWNVWSYSLHLGERDFKNGIAKNPTLNVPMFDLDSGLIFERPVAICDIPFTQTLEPRAYYLWVPFRNQNNLPIFDTTYSGFDYNQLFRDNRFSGLDRVGDANQVTLALTSRLLTDASGSERASATIGQIYYFKNRKVTLCNPSFNPLCVALENPHHPHHRHASNLVGLARYHLTQAWSATATAQWNPYKHKTDERAAWLQYRPSEMNVLNLGYLFLRRNPAQFDPTTFLPKRLEQAEVSFAWALTERWRILGRYQYDKLMHRANEVLAGVEQQSCCIAVRLSYARYLQPNDINNPKPMRKYQNAVYFQFIFKGLAGIGHSRINTITTRVPGYKFNDNQF